MQITKDLIKGFALFIAILVTFISTAQNSNKAVVDYKSNQMKVIKSGDSTVIKLIGDVVFFHNGAIITCDSAYRYSERKMDGMGRVVINQDSVYIYGDRFTYNGETNIAEVFAPIIKTVDGDVTLYTRNMHFNTQTKIGEYSHGGTMTQRDNLMESERGVYYTDRRYVDFSGDVAMCNDNYIIATDSIGYNMNNEVVTFYVHTNIWNHKGEFLSADKGTYHRLSEVYNFTENSYILTDDQELWADELIYFSPRQEALLTKNIQMLDTAQQVITFGDKGRYWGASRRVLLTEDPSALAYDSQTGDTIYTRADTMLVYPALKHIAIDSITADTLVMVDSLRIDSLSGEALMAIEPLDLISDSTQMELSVQDTIVVDSIAIKSPLPDTIDLKLGSATDSLLTPKQKKRLERIERRQEKQRRRLAQMLEHDGHHHVHEEDSTAVLVDSIALDTIPLKDISVDVIEDSNTKADSSDYVLNGFNNVRIFRSDMQAVCDSLVMISTDSTMHMFNRPIVWNEGNQITAEKITIFSKNSQLYRAELDNFPILAQAIDTTKGMYNQIRGKFMEAFFKDNKLYELDVNGNSQAIYYRGENGVVDGIMNTASANMEIYFEDNKIAIMKWFQTIDTGTYPLDKVTSAVNTMLDGFSWQIDRRPKTKESVFNREIRPSQRVEMIAIEEPLFSITEKIDSDKVKFTEEGIWSDRNELITIDKESLRNDDL